MGISLEAPIESLPAKLSAPAPEAVGAVRQRGSVSFKSNQDLEVLLENLEGLTQQSSGVAANSPHSRLPVMAHNLSAAIVSCDSLSKWTSPLLAPNRS